EGRALWGGGRGEAPALLRSPDCPGPSADINGRIGEATLSSVDRSALLARRVAHRGLRPGRWQKLWRVQRLLRRPDHRRAGVAKAPRLSLPQRPAKWRVRHLRDAAADLPEVLLWLARAEM